MLVGGQGNEPASIFPRGFIHSIWGRRVRLDLCAGGCQAVFDSLLIVVWYGVYMDERKEEVYHSYLLRFWRVANKDGSVWRYQLENPHTGQRHGFNDLSQLIAFLDKLIAAGATMSKNCPL